MRTHAGTIAPRLLHAGIATLILVSVSPLRTVVLPGGRPTPRPPLV